MLIQEASVNLHNMLTLRYDPTLAPTPSTSVLIALDKKHRPKLRIRRRSSPPSSYDIESAIKKGIRAKIEQPGVRRISLALSAGVDSNVVASLVRKEAPDIPIHCLTVSFDESSEAPIAKKIAESLDVEFHEIKVDNPLKNLPLLISIIKEPRWNIYQYYLFEEARSISDLIFTGDGGDELFAGYVFRYKKYLDNLKKNFTWLEKTQLYLQCHERDWVPDQEEMFGEKIAFNWQSIYLVLKPFFDNNMDTLEQVLRSDFNGKLLYDFIPTNQKYKEYFDLDIAAPLLSDDVVELSMKIPVNMKYDYSRNIGKLPLRDILKRNMSFDIGDNKMGFGMDLVKFWFRQGKDIVTSNLEHARIFEDKVINRDWYVKSLIRIQDTKDPRYINKMFQLFALELWYKMFITRELSVVSSV